LSFNLQALRKIRGQLREKGR